MRGVNRFITRNQQGRAAVGAQVSKTSNMCMYVCVYVYVYVFIDMYTCIYIQV